MKLKPCAPWTFGVPEGRKEKHWEFPSRGPSGWHLIVDTETSTDEAQRRRHVKISGVTYIGKEANRWEEQSYLGIDLEAEITYGASPKERNTQLAQLKIAAGRFGLSKLAREAGASRQHVTAVLAGDAIPSEKLLAKLSRGTAALELYAFNGNMETEALVARVKDIGVRRSAAIAGIDAGHLTRLVNGKRRPTMSILEKLKRAVAGADQASTKGQRRPGDAIELKISIQSDPAQS
jgi:transcriptional regulator with XRE-family HTH domain